MTGRIEIRIPAPLADTLLRLAAETELPLEDIVETAFKNYLERRFDNG